MAVAIHNYETAYGRLPPPWVSDPNGTPLLSWRVLILPYIEQEELYKQFHLDEPWDSPHNIQLLARMPKTYAPLGREPAEMAHRTYFRTFIGLGTAFEPGRAVRFEQDFPDGRGNTLLVVDAGEAVPWTKPEELPFGPGLPLPPLGGMFPKTDTFIALLGDGTVLSLRKSLDESVLRALITRDGGEELPIDWGRRSVNRIGHPPTARAPSA